MSDDSEWTHVEPDPARATAFYVKAIVLMLFAYLFASVGAAAAIVSQAVVWLVGGGLLAIGALYLAAEAYFAGNRQNRWTMERRVEDEE